MQVTITSLLIYPIKSCSGLEVGKIVLDELGAANDRRYMLVDENGYFVTQRQHARLVHVYFTEHPLGWLVSSKGNSSQVLPFQGSMDISMEVEIWGDRFLAYDQGDEWAGFFSGFLGKKVRLVFTGRDTAREIDKNYSIDNRKVSFADGFPLLITNEQSLSILNSQLEKPITMQRFRPNIVVAGAEAFAENSWQHLSGTDARLAVVKPCSRCVIPTINLETAVKESDVWKVLERNCLADDGKVYFGQNLIHLAEGVLRKGETLLVE